MTNHLKSYLDILAQSSPDAVSSVRKTVEKLMPEHIEQFTHREHIVGLLLGQVQSGKTGQMLGITAATADTDPGFNIFILLTSSSSALQQQTFKRAMESMDTFNVCDENDEVRFRSQAGRKPTLIILKKNTKILGKWRNTLASSGLIAGRPIFVIDDEADNASPNTKVNQKDISTINKHLSHILSLSTSSVYLQVTATPQSLLLQSDESAFKPTFVHYFPPGKNYLGGDFFYSDPKPFTNITTDDDELEVLLKSAETPEGMTKAIDTYLVTSAHIMLSGDSKVCNFLIHPSSGIGDHEKIYEKVLAYLGDTFLNIDQPSIRVKLEAAWKNLQESKPDIRDFQEVMDYLKTKPEIEVTTMNSGPSGKSRLTYEDGLNIVIGGNSLGRGVTFKSLQTVYYCRSAKSPQADTFWQHCRMFGYDRDRQLMRVFMPLPLFKMFAEINASGETLLKAVEEERFDEMQIVTTGKTKPTRKNVVDQSKYSYIVGGVNYFPPQPDQSSQADVENALEGYDDKAAEHDVSFEDAVSILKQFSSDPVNGWNMTNYINAIKAAGDERKAPKTLKLIVRRGRKISNGTRTLLSPDDRRTTMQYEDRPVITLYQLTGDKDLGWDGKPFWVPNIKLTNNRVYHNVE